MNVLIAINQSVAMINPALATYQIRLAAIVCPLGQMLELPPRTMCNIFIAALLYDIEKLAGLSSHNLVGPVIHSRSNQWLSACNRHIDAGERLNLIDAIFCHITGKPGDDILQMIESEAQRAQASDLIDFAIYAEEQICNTNQGDCLSASASIRCRIISHQKKPFLCEVVEAFKACSAHESFWLNMENNHLDNAIKLTSPLRNTYILDEEFLSMCQLFLFVLSCHDKASAIHCQQVGVLARRIAMAAGLDYLTVIKVETAGYLHDIGKLAIPVTILTKPGPLTETEQLIVKRHSFTTGVLLSRIVGIKDIASWAENHHERGDGRGYPYGRNKQSLPAYGQIIALADVYTALTERRPYKAALTRQQALALVIDEFKSEFTPFVEALITATA